MFDIGGSWTNTGYGFQNDSNIALGYDGTYQSLNTLLDAYINIPEVVLSGNSSGWGSQMQNHFNSFMKGRNGDYGLYGAIGRFSSYLASLIGSTNETFYSFSGGTNDPDKETLNKLRPHDNVEANDMFQTIFMFYGRNTKLSGGTTGFQEALVQFGLDSEVVLDLNKSFFNKNDTIYFSDYTFDKNGIKDTIYKTTLIKGDSYNKAWERLYKTADSTKRSKW
jgi:hypothetical protein